MAAYQFGSSTCLQAMEGEGGPWLVPLTTDLATQRALEFLVLVRTWQRVGGVGIDLAYRSLLFVSDT